tara:strand:+ start:2731 stop:3216 length:486 start_codon:yes stop_codon:yes gene_type:complete
MKIEENCVVYISFKMTDESKNILDEASTEQPLPFIFGRGQIVPGLEDELKGKTKGDKVTVTLEPDDAFGEFEEDYLQLVKKELFQDVGDIEIGMDIEVEMDTEDGQMMAMAKVVEDNGDQILIDLNHPFAGRKLTYNVEVLDVREQTPEEEDLGTIKEFIN